MEPFKLIEVVNWIFHYCNMLLVIISTYLFLCFLSEYLLVCRNLDSIKQILFKNKQYRAFKTPSFLLSLQTEGVV
jgi:hypothetical protein